MTALNAFMEGGKSVHGSYHVAGLGAFLERETETGG
jgi:hypothetical protein